MSVISANVWRGLLCRKPISVFEAIVHDERRLIEQWGKYSDTKKDRFECMQKFVNSFMLIGINPIIISL